MSDKILLQHKVIIENRGAMSVDGVTQVVAYDENRIVLRTDYGTLIVTGRDLVAGEISSSNNTMKLTGNIDTLQYKGSRDKREGLLSRITR
ncbi:MAG: YabP/YqfC family sporulation protein [Oscillospiraceae bacterium]|nr:sporulation protein [Oscillospiraceae bacterium]MBR6608588.1 YabP/YqfC family sporulation protein [Oscillospiraceae bacterium]